MQIIYSIRKYKFNKTLQQTTDIALERATPQPKSLSSAVESSVIWQEYI